MAHLMTLKAARVNAGLTQVQAAKIVGIHPQTLAKYETNSTEIRVHLVKKLAKVDSVPIDYLFLGKYIDLKRINSRKSQCY